MTPVDVLGRLLTVDKPVASRILGGMGVFAAAALIASWNINVEYAAYTGGAILVFGLLAYVLGPVVSGSVLLGRVIAWSLLALFMVWSSSILAATIFVRQDVLPPAYCIINFWKACGDQSKRLAQDDPTPSPTDASAYKVYVQFWGVDRDKVRALDQTLLVKGRWHVKGAGQGGDQIPQAQGYNEVRYRQGSDEAAALALANQVQAVNLTDHPIVAVQNASVKSQSLELWLSR